MIIVLFIYINFWETDFLHFLMFYRVPLCANYIALRCVNAGVYQYAVSYRPVVDSRGMRSKMLNEHKNVIGETKAFDGAILFLPIQLPDKVSEVFGIFSFNRFHL